MSDRASRIDALLPQIQCRKCGYDGCAPYATAIDRGLAAINRCPPGGDKLIAALETRDADFLRSIPRAALLSGSSEILNWIAAAGALEHLSVNWKQYIPIRRSPAGTGICGKRSSSWSRAQATTCIGI